MTTLARQLAQDLRSLMAIPIASEADLAHWIAKADLLREKLATVYRSLHPYIAEELDRYLEDPGIRLKDFGSSERQTQAMLRLIADLESGKIDELARKIKTIGDSGSLWRSGVLRAAYVVFLCFAILQLTVFLNGYGSWMHFLVFPGTIVLFLVSCAAAGTYGNMIKYRLDGTDVVLVLLLCIAVNFLSYQVGWYARLLYRAPLLHSADEIVAVLDKYKRDHGSYPTDSKYISSLALPKGIRVYTESAASDGELRWSVSELGDSDITVLTEPKNYEVYVPVEKVSPISFSSFAVYGYLSSDPKWRLGRTHWAFFYAHWTPN
jgi:hypothetical protein